MRRRLLTTVVAALLVAGPSGCGDEGEAVIAAEEITVDGVDALLWGDGPYGVVIAHGAASEAGSWSPLAARIAAEDATVLAVEQVTSDSLLQAAEHLIDELGIAEVAFVGASRGADEILELASNRPSFANQLILISPNRTVDMLDESPMLFVAADGDRSAAIVRQLAAVSPGVDDEVLIVPGSAHGRALLDFRENERLVDVVLARIAEFRST